MNLNQDPPQVLDRDNIVRVNVPQLTPDELNAFIRANRNNNQNDINDLAYPELLFNLQNGLNDDPLLIHLREFRNDVLLNHLVPNSYKNRLETFIDKYEFETRDYNLYNQRKILLIKKLSKSNERNNGGLFGDENVQSIFQGILEALQPQFIQSFAMVNNHSIFIHNLQNQEQILNNQLIEMLGKIERSDLRVRDITTVLEDMGDNIDQINETLNDINERMERFEQRLEERMERFEQRLEERMERFEQRLEERIAHVSNQLERILDHLGLSDSSSN